MPSETTAGLQTEGGRERGREGKKTKPPSPPFWEPVDEPLLPHVPVLLCQLPEIAIDV